MTVPRPVLRLVAVAELPAPGDPAWAGLLTPAELAYCLGLAKVGDHLAARVAAKAAVAALLGFDPDGQPSDVEVRRAPGAAPRVLLAGAADRAAGGLAVGVSLSHAAGHAAALAWATGPAAAEPPATDALATEPRAGEP